MNAGLEGCPARELALQTTLLGLAIAIILALVAALVGPLLIDWGGHRTLFEAEASRLIGVDVRVTGAIDARLLPTPSLTLHGVEIGKTGANQIRARSLGFEFALGPLMRGEWHASEMHLVSPQLSLGLDASGRVQAPNLAINFSPDNLSIDHLSVEDGKVTLTDASNGARATLEGFWFNGEARSLLGPFKGEGAVTVGGELYPFRISGGRYSDDGALKLHVNVDPVNHPLSIEADGMLALAGAQPQFDGNLSLTRPVGIAPRSAAQVTQPWHVSGKIKVSAVSALMEQFEFQYGSDEQALKLTGVADFKFGKNPRFDGVLSGRQIDLDRVLAGSDGGRPPPAAAIRKIAELAGGAFRPAVPIQIGIGIDQVSLGGNSVTNVRGDISTDAKGWNLDRFEFRAPGFTQVKLSGHLAVAGDGVNFTGPAEIEAGDPKALAAWLEGRTEVTQGDMRPLTLRGDVTLGSDKIAVERLQAAFDRKTVTGRLAYVFAAGKRVAKLDAALNAPELDIDAALGFGKALLAGSTIERPHDMTIAADIGRATIGGFVARDASARIKVDGNGVQIDRLAVADLGGAAFSASGRIVTAPSPQGSMRVDLDAPDMTPVMALLARVAPKTAQALERGAPAMAPAKLHAQFTVDGAKPAVAKLAIDGSLGKVRIALNGEANADPVTFRAGEVKFDGKLEAGDGKALVAMLGLDKVLAVDGGPGALTLKANGPARGQWRLDGKLSAGGLEASASGTAQPFADNPSAALRATIARADMAPLRGNTHAPLPVTFAGNVALTSNDLTLSEIDASIAGSALRGKLGLTLQSPRRLQGDIDADSIDAAGLIAAAIGMPPGRQQRRRDVVERAVRRRRIRRLRRRDRAQGAPRRLAAAADGTRVPRHLAFRQGRDRPRRHERRRRRRTPGRSVVVPLRRGWLESARQDFAHRRRCGEPAAVRRAAAGQRIARACGRCRRDGLEPGRADRLAARGGQDRARRRAIRRPRSARFRCRHPRGGSRAADRCRPHLRRGAQSSRQRPACDQTRRRHDRRERRAGAAEQCHRRRQGRRSVARRQSRSHRWLDRRAARALGIGPGWRRAARYLHGVEGAAGGAGAQHRRVGADRMADAAGGRKSGEAIARN